MAFLVIFIYHSIMAVDIKDLISDTARRLILDGNGKKLTVTDIVNECRITRQAFYYHFKDLPDLLEWSFRNKGQGLTDSIINTESVDESVGNLLLFCINLFPVVMKGVSSSYRIEIERIAYDHMKDLMERIADRWNLFPGYSKDDRAIVIRYHMQAIIGFVAKWGSAEADSFDRISGIICSMLKMS